jgi:hypothetical protein
MKFFLYFHSVMVDLADESPVILKITVYNCCFKRTCFKAVLNSDFYDPLGFCPIFSLKKSQCRVRKFSGDGRYCSSQSYILYRKLFSPSPTGSTVVGTVDI